MVSDINPTAEVMHLGDLPSMLSSVILHRPDLKPTELSRSLLTDWNGLWIKSHMKSGFSIEVVLFFSLPPAYN